MKIFSYVIKSFFKYVAGAVILSLFLFVLFDFIHKTTKYIPKYHPSAGLLFQYYLYQIPAQLIQALPIASLLASVITMILLNRTNEVTAMRAAGMGPLAIGAPLAVGGLFLGIFAFVLSNFILPRASARMHYIEDVQIQKENNDELAQGARWIRSGQSFFNFGDYDPVQKVLTGIKLFIMRPSFRPETIFEASSAKYIDDRSIWLLADRRVIHYKPNGTVENVETLEGIEYELPIQPAKLKKERRIPGELSIKELQEAIAKGEESGAETLPLKVDMQTKIAFPFAAFVVALIGIRFGYRSERSPETAKGILTAFAIGMSYWFILNAAGALGKRGDLPPIFAAWSANFIISCIAGFQLWRTTKES